MKERRACGWILVAPSARVLLLRNRQRGDWGVPKGHMEDGESETDTALRELDEETGLTLDQIIPRPDWRRTLTYYPVDSRGARYEKTTVLFAADCAQPWPIRLSREHDAAEWTVAARLGGRLTHEDLRQLVTQTLKDSP